MTTGKCKFTLDLKGYSGNNRAVERIADALDRYHSDVIVCAIVHGSIGNGDEIFYSDLDALIIIKDDACLSQHCKKKIKAILRKTERLFFTHDMLQHHGWFTLKEADLEKYPEHYLPIAALCHAKSIYPKNGISLAFQPVFNPEKVRMNFETLAEKIEGKLIMSRYPRNIYQLKSLLSQFMLLPTFYVQDRDGKGIDKKSSFNLAKNDFTPIEWAIMDEVSAIRMNWHYSVNHIQRFLLTRSGPFRYFCARRMPISIPADIRSRLTCDFFNRMNKLIGMMRRNVSARWNNQIVGSQQL